MYALPTSCNLLLRLNSTILYSLLLTPQLPVPPLACEFNQGMLPHGIYIRAGRWEGIPIGRTHFVDAFFVLTKQWYVFHFANVCNLSVLDRLYKKRLVLSIEDPSPLLPP